MFKLLTLTDRVAITLSLLCTIHCLATPLLLVVMPGLASLGLENEAFHLWMIALVIPTSAYALTMGCQQHQNYRLIVIGALGLMSLIAAVTIGEALLGEAGEKIFTVLGSALLAFAHISNYRACKNTKTECCDCSDEAASQV